MLSDSSYASNVGNTIFIGIGYVGNNIARRRRDFIPPIFASSNVGEDNPNYGHADRFHAFLSQQLIPTIDKRYNTNGRRTLIGHSFGGLFVMYALFRSDLLFQNVIALSPSLWVNHGDIFHYENARGENGRSLDAYLYLSAGTRETINRVLTTTRQMEKVLKERKYEGLKIDYAEHIRKGHNSQVPVSLAYVLQHASFWKGRGH